MTRTNRSTAQATLAALTLILLMLLPWNAYASDESPRSFTLMVYMCGSNLESKYGSASGDLNEISSSCRKLRNTSVLVMTGGASQWMTGYPADQNLIIEMNQNRIVWQDDAQNMGEKETLTKFIQICMDKYPADQYALILWDHGGGPLEGVCQDELFSMDQLSLQELCDALEGAALPKKLAWVGFDACLMGSAEVALAMSPYAEYMIASQEREPSIGWNYDFLKDIEQDRNGAETGKRIVERYFAGAKKDPNPHTLSCIDLSKLSSIIPSLDSFFANVTKSLTPETYSELSILRLDSIGFGKMTRGLSGSSYDLVDLQDLIKKLGKNRNEGRLITLLQEAIVYNESTVPGAAGLSVYHPFSNKEDYLLKWGKDYKGIPFSSQYQDYIERFGSLLVSDEMANWRGLTADRVSDQPNDRPRFMMKLSEQQQKNYAKGQLLILAAYDRESGIYGVVDSRDNSEKIYTPVSVSEAWMESDGAVYGEFTGRMLYATDQEGHTLCGPLTYELSEDGLSCFVRGTYYDNSGREDWAENMDAMFTFAMTEDNDTPLKLSGVMGYDTVSGTYKSRIPVNENEYSMLSFRLNARTMPHHSDNMPGFENWDESASFEHVGSLSIELPTEWQLRFYDTQMSAIQLHAFFQVTDVQQITHSSYPVLIENPNLEDIQIEPRITETSDYRIRFFLMRDSSVLNPGLNLAMEITNLSSWNTSYAAHHLLLNKIQAGSPGLEYPFMISDVQPGETRTEVFHLDRIALMNLDQITDISLQLMISSNEHRYEKGERRIRFRVSQCSLEGISETADTVLGRAEKEKLTWELIRFEKKASGDYDALLQITNMSDQALNELEYIAVNGVYLDHESSCITIQVPSGAVAYYRISIQNSIELHKEFTANGRFVYYTLHAAHQLEKNGVSEITNIQIIRKKPEALQESLRIGLNTPVQLEEQETDANINKRLLDGQICAEAERVFLADDGLGIRTVFTNPTENDVLIQYGGFTVNGNPAANSESTVPFIVPACGKAVSCIGISWTDHLDVTEKPERIGLFFRVNQEYCSTEAVIELYPDVYGSSYLEPERYDITPGIYHRPEMLFVSDYAQAEGEYDLKVEGKCCNGDPNDSSLMFDRETVYYSFSLYITNKGQNERRFTFSNLGINEARVTGETWEPVLLLPGETAVSTVRVSEIQMLGLQEIQKIYFDVAASDDTDALKEEKHFEFGMNPITVSPNAAEESAFLAEGSTDSLYWGLLEIKENEQGQLFLGLYAENSSSYQTFDSEIDVLLDDWWLGRIGRLVLRPGESTVAEILFENQISIPPETLRVTGRPEPVLLERHILQNRETKPQCRVRVIWENDGEPREIVLEPTGTAPYYETQDTQENNSLLLNENRLNIYLRRLLVGEWDLAVELDVINETEQSIRLCISDPLVNQQAFYLDQETEYKICPHSGRNLCVFLRYGERTSMRQERNFIPLQQGDLILDISLAASIDGEPVLLSFAIPEETPLGDLGGRMIDGSNLLLKANRPQLLLQNAAELKADSVSPVVLAPAMDENQAAAFAKGTATVYLRREAAFRYRVVERGTDNYDQFLPELQKICELDLSRDSQGRILSHYSGLTWTNTSGEIIAGYENQNALAGVLDFSDESTFYPSLVATIYQDWHAYKFIPPLGSSQERALPILGLGVIYAVDISGESPEIAGYTQYIFNPQQEIMTDYYLENGQDMVCTGHQERLVMKNEKVIQTETKERQIIRMNDLRLVRADQMEGSLMIRYDITYQNGETESIWETYPYE